MLLPINDPQISPLMRHVTDRTLLAYEGGTIPKASVQSINDAESIETAVGGEAIFKLMNRAIALARWEILIQTFAYERDIPAIGDLRRTLELIANQKREEKKNGSVNPLRLYLLIDERGPIAHYAFTGGLYRSWPLTPESVGLFHEPGIVEVYVDVFSHDSLAGNHAKTVVVDGQTLFITGANLQSSNYGHLPAHDAGWLITGGVAKSARSDFAAMWSKRKNSELTSNLIPLPAEIPESRIRRPISLLFTTRLPKRVRRMNILDNPQNAAFLSAIEEAKQIIQIATPNLNATFILNALARFINEKKGKVELLLGKGFNDQREATWFMGGSNQVTVDALFSKVLPQLRSQLALRWFSLNGKDPVLGNVAGACHLKFMSIDRQLTIVGNANLDVISTVHLHEANVVIDDAAVTQKITRAVFDSVFEKGIPAKPTEGVVEKYLENVGYRGWQELLGPKFTIELVENLPEGQGFQTMRFSKPSGWSFQPGQYVEIRSGSFLGKAAQKAPAVLAIASGKDDRYLELTARASVLPWSSNHCLNGKPGDKLEIIGPLGTCFPMDLAVPGKPVILIGGGSGLTVIRSLYRSLPEGIKPRIYFTAQTEEHLFYKPEIERWKNEGHTITLTQEKKEGYSHGRLNAKLREMPLTEDCLVFICGPVPLIHDMIELLLKRNISPQHIYASLPYDAKQGGPVYRGDHPKINRRR